jgi:hypothetical protein
LMCFLYLFWLSTKKDIVMAKVLWYFLSQCKPDVVKNWPILEPEELIDGIFEGDVQLDCVTPDSILLF